MKRSLMQVYVKSSDKAVVFYQKAFDATLLCAYSYDDGTYMHSELVIEGQVLAVSERNDENSQNSKETITSNTMQFCLHYGQGNEDKVRRAYEVLKDDAQIIYPLSKCDYSPLMTDLIDKYGVRWCIFI